MNAPHGLAVPRGEAAQARVSNQCRLRARACTKRCAFSPTNTATRAATPILTPRPSLLIANQLANSFRIRRVAFGVTRFHPAPAVQLGCAVQDMARGSAASAVRLRVSAQEVCLNCECAQRSHAAPAVISIEGSMWRVSVVRGARVESYLCESEAKARRWADLLNEPLSESVRRPRSTVDSPPNELCATARSLRLIRTGFIGWKPRP